MFKDFPHNQKIIPIINTREKLKCSCTLIWLLIDWEYKKLKYNGKEDVNGTLSMNTTSVMECFIDFKIKKDKCNFEKKLRKCGVKNMTGYSYECKSQTTANAIKNCLEKYLKISITFLVSFIGFILNILSLIVMLSQKYSQNMYKYLTMEIFFQLIPLLFFSMNPFFENFYINSNDTTSLPVFSKCQIHIFIENKKLIEIKTLYLDSLANISINCAIFANFFMTLDRFLFITSSRKFKWFYESKKTYKKVFVFILIICVLININQFFLFLQNTLTAIG